MGVPAPLVKYQPPEYRIAATLMLMAEQLMNKNQSERQKHEAAVARHSKHH